MAESDRWLPRFGLTDDFLLFRTRYKVQGTRSAVHPCLTTLFRFTTVKPNFLQSSSSCDCRVVSEGMTRVIEPEKLKSVAPLPPLGLKSIEKIKFESFSGYHGLNNATFLCPYLNWILDIVPIHNTFSLKLTSGKKGDNAQQCDGFSPG